MTIAEPPASSTASGSGVAGRPDTIEPLWTADLELIGTEIRGGELPAELRARYGAPLAIPLRSDRPTLVANFVSTLDGIVALDRHGTSTGQAISGGFDPDRFVMGLLRSLADAVLVGAGTVRASRTHGWTPRRAHPRSAAAFARWRQALGLDVEGPATVIVTASGALDAAHLPTDPQAPVILVTTSSGARRLQRLATAGNNLEIVALGDGPSIPADALVAFLDQGGFRLVVTEGGPTLFGRLVTAQFVDEVFLTLAPRLAGRSAAVPRLSLVEDAALDASAGWGRLRSVMRSSDYLFLRYQLSPEA